MTRSQSRQATGLNGRPCGDFLDVIRGHEFQDPTLESLPEDRGERLVLLEQESIGDFIHKDDVADTQLIVDCLIGGDVSRRLKVRQTVVEDVGQGGIPHSTSCMKVATSSGGRGSTASAVSAALAGTIPARSPSD